jgi:RNase adapter protein RapZ
LAEQQTIVILTGCSGSGKNTALAAFEDAGFYCVDNMPVLVIDHFLQTAAKDASPVVGWVFVMDLRDKHFLTHIGPLCTDLKKAGYNLLFVFLEADEQVLLRRYNQTRRPHPLGHRTSLLEAIRAENRLIAPLRKLATHTINTSNFSVHELKFAILSIAQHHMSISGMAINVVSFGFKYGAPTHADLMMDVRFLNNPYFVPELKPKSGEDIEIIDFVSDDKQTELFLKHYLPLLDYLIPLYEKEGKAYLTIAIGCTGGRHRSVVIARIVFQHLEATRPNVRLTHRDIGYG